MDARRSLLNNGGGDPYGAIPFRRRSLDWASLNIGLFKERESEMETKIEIEIEIASDAIFNSTRF